MRIINRKEYVCNFYFHYIHIQGLNNVCHRGSTACLCAVNVMSDTYQLQQENWILIIYNYMPFRRKVQVKYC